jgi:hypothetical protein
MEIDLLEYIASKISGVFISDIRPCTDFSKRIAMTRCISRIDSNACSLREWNDVAQYITGAHMHFYDREAAKEFILCYLKINA